MRKSLMPEHDVDTSEAQSRGLLELTRELLAIVSANGEFLFVNKGFERVLGYSAQELLGKSLIWLHPPSEAPKMHKKFAAIVAGEGAEAAGRCSLRAKSGQWRWFAVIPANRLHDPDVRGIFLHSHDFTKFHPPNTH